MVGVLLDDRAQPVVVQQVVLAVAQVQHDLGAALGPVHRLQRVLAPAAGLPADAFGGGQPGPPGGQRHPVRHHERGVEAHAELADQGRVLALVAGQRRQELAGARLGDGADVVDHLRPAHADAVIADGDRARRGVKAHPDLQRAGLLLLELGVRERLEAQPVNSVRGVGDQLAQEYLLVYVQRVDHQIQDLDHLGLETEAFGVRLRGHRASPWRSGHVRPRGINGKGRPARDRFSVIRGQPRFAGGSSPV